MLPYYQTSCGRLLYWVSMARVSHKKSPVKNIIEFIKLQLAGNILFVGTLLGVAVADHILYTDPFWGLVGGSIVAHVLFFLVNKNWIFHTSSRQGYGEILRFVIFMTFNFFLNIFLVSLLTRLILIQMPSVEGFEYYLGVIAAAVFFAIWSYIGLKFWVFTSTKPHAAVSRHHGLTYERKRRRA